MTRVVLRAVERLRSGHGLTFRERIQVERAVFRLTAARVRRDLGQDILSMSGTAYRELCAKYSRDRDGRPPLAVMRGFEAIDMIRALASADPYVVNENISQLADKAPTGLATLPAILSECAELALSDRCSLPAHDRRHPEN